MNRIHLPLSARCLAVLLCSPPALAAPPPDAPGASPPSLQARGCEIASETPGARCTPLPEDALAGLRGGYNVAPGLRASFGLTLLTLVNGEVAARSAINIPDLGQITPEQAAGLRAIWHTPHLVQNGPGNLFQIDQPLKGGPLVAIQNTLNDQIIQHWTTLSATTNSLHLLKNQNAFSTLMESLKVR